MSITLKTKPLNQNTLIDVELVKNHLGLGFSDDEDLYYLTAVVIPAAVRMIENMTWLSIFHTEIEMRVAGQDLNLDPVKLRRGSHISVSSVQYRTSSHKSCKCWTDCEFCVDEHGEGPYTFFTVYKKDNVYHCGNCHSCGGCYQPKETKIQYEAGYKCYENIPPDLLQGILLATRYVYDGGDDCLLEVIENIIADSCFRVPVQSVDCYPEDYLRY